MKYTKEIESITNTLLHKSNEVKSTGLYFGKAGLSLSLFIASDSLQDEKTEDKAFQLLQESLVTINSNLSFENGLAGIGYTLLYLIENKYVDADFDDIFKIQFHQLINTFNNIDKDPEKLLDSFQVIYFFSKVRNYKSKESDQLQAIIKKIFEGIELFLALQFHDFTDVHYITKKIFVLNIYKSYLKLVDYSGYSDFSRFLLDVFALLYRKGKIISSLETGYYLNRITNKHTIIGYEDVISANIDYGIKNIYPITLSMKERIDLAKIMYSIKNGVNKKDANLSNIINFRLESVTKILEKTKSSDFTSYGYSDGVARLLIFYVNKDVELL